MAPTFTYAELAQDLGTNTADGLRNVANTAANFVCDAYKNYADATLGLPDPTGVGAFNNALYSRLCSPRDSVPPNPPAPAFNGGQCAGLPYNVTITFKRPDNTTGSVFFGSVPGPLQGTGVKQTGAESGVLGVFAPNSPGLGILSVASAGGPNWREGLANWSITSVSIVPVGHSDNCGNPPPQYRSPAPPGNTYNTTKNVNIGAGLVIVAPVTIIPTLIKANVDIDAQIQVDVGPFNVNFDLGGVQIKPNFQIGGDKSTPPPTSVPPGTPAPRPPQSLEKECDTTEIENTVNNLEIDLGEVLEKLDEVIDCSCPVEYTTNIVGLASGQTGVVPLPKHTIQVRLQLTKIPANAKVQTGGGSHPNFFFCGYIDWGDGSGLSERRPISVENSVFDAPQWASSFGWVLYGGYEGTVSARTLVPSKSDAELATKQMKRGPA